MCEVFSQNLYLFQNYESKVVSKVLKVHAFILRPTEVIQKNKHRLICQLCPVGMDADPLIYILLSVWWVKIFFIWAAKYFTQELSYGLSYRYGPFEAISCFTSSRAASEAALKPVTARFRFKILGRSARFDHNHSSDGPAAAAVKPSRHRFRLIYCAGYVPGISCHVLARNTRRVPRPNGPTRPDRSLGRARVGYFIQPEPHQAGPSRLGPQI